MEIPKKELTTKKQFREAVSYIKESQKYIYATILIFVASAIMGFIFKDDLTIFNELIKKLIDRTQGLNAPELIFFIFQNNLQSSLLGILSGLLFGIFPIFYILINGLLVGYVSGIVSDSVGLSTLWQLAPHGIFELPAIFISLGIGIKLGFSLFLSSHNRVYEFKRRFYNSANTFLMIVIPLLIIAAIIEGVLIAFVG